MLSRAIFFDLYSICENIINQGRLFKEIIGVELRRFTFDCVLSPEEAVSHSSTHSSTESVLIVLLIVELVVVLIVVLQVVLIVVLLVAAEQGCFTRLPTCSSHAQLQQNAAQSTASTVLQYTDKIYTHSVHHSCTRK